MSPFGREEQTRLPDPSPAEFPAQDLAKASPASSVTIPERAQFPRGSTSSSRVPGSSAAAVLMVFQVQTSDGRLHVLLSPPFLRPCEHMHSVCSPRSGHSSSCSCGLSTVSHRQPLLLPRSARRHFSIKELMFINRIPAFNHFSWLLSFTPHRLL